MLSQKLTINIIPIDLLTLIVFWIVYHIKTKIQQQVFSLKNNSNIHIWSILVCNTSIIVAIESDILKRS